MLPAPERTAKPLVQPRAQNAPEVHGFKFRLVYTLLAVVLGAAAGVFVVLLSRGSSGSSVAWSAWQPSGGDFRKTKEIAALVGSQYRLSSGKQLVAVIAQMPPEVQQVPISHIALAEGTSTSDISVFSAGNNSVEYILCGVGGQRCSIAEGKPSTQRGRLLHRESLELALYTFKYTDSIDSVVTFLPPVKGANPTYALFFQKGDFADELGHPLRATIPGRGPFTPEAFPAIQQAEISRLVLPHLFQYRYQQAPDGSAVLVLQPPAA